MKKFKSIATYCIFILLVIVLADVYIFKKVMNLGYETHFNQENYQRYPAPYIEFTGKPNESGHNELGFKGSVYTKEEIEDISTLKIAFFGGSTGYHGNPPIAELIRQQLMKELNIDVAVMNYSVVSSNHRQHIHMMTEYLQRYSPDLVIFYGGYNETLQTGFYDPRPGYPYNFFYRGELSPLRKLLLEKSALAGEFDKKTSKISKLKALKEKYQPFSENWNKKLISSYFETLEIANKLTQTFASKKFQSNFFAFYQPYQVLESFQEQHNTIKAKHQKLDYFYDYSNVYDMHVDSAYTDIVHVKQFAREIMADQITNEIILKLNL